jgi:hypothetical protein
MASGGGRSMGREDSARGRVLHGRYSKMRDGRLSGNRWELLDEEEQGGGGKDGATEGRDGTLRGKSGEREMEVEGVGGNEQSTQERGGEGDVRRKRILKERSPGVHKPQRVNKRRVNEFEMRHSSAAVADGGQRMGCVSSMSAPSDCSCGTL